jgi:hypothetical protein
MLVTNVYPQQQQFYLPAIGRKPNACIFLLTAALESPDSGRLAEGRSHGEGRRRDRRPERSLGGELEGEGEGRRHQSGARTGGGRRWRSGHHCSDGRTCWVTAYNLWVVCGSLVRLVVGVVWRVVRREIGEWVAVGASVVVVVMQARVRRGQVMLSLGRGFTSLS